MTFEVGYAGMEKGRRGTMPILRSDATGPGNHLGMDVNLIDKRYSKSFLRFGLWRLDNKICGGLSIGLLTTALLTGFGNSGQRQFMPFITYRENKKI